jgi:Fe-Mn family superoxide dismutase
MTRRISDKSFDATGDTMVPIEQASLHRLPPMPYAENELHPVISANTLGFHHDKHDQAYVDTLSKLLTGMELTTLSLKLIIAETVGNS